MTTPHPEPWLRGPVEGYDPLVVPVVHALTAAREEIDALVATLPNDAVWQRPGGAASIGFHIRHLGGAVDRLCTLARGERLSDEQKAFARAEGEPGESLSAVTAGMNQAITRALEQVRGVTREELLTDRQVGKTGGATMLGVLFHAAEHATRHAGQAVTTAKILAGEVS